MFDFGSFLFLHIWLWVYVKVKEVASVEQPDMFFWIFTTGYRWGLTPVFGPKDSVLLWNYLDSIIVLGGIAKSSDVKREESKKRTKT